MYRYRSFEFDPKAVLLLALVILGLYLAYPYLYQSYNISLARSFATVKESPQLVQAPNVTDPYEAGEWTVIHTVHGLTTNESLDSLGNLTALREAIARKGYAVTYCYGISLIWSWILHENHYPSAIIIASIRGDNRYLHAFGVTYWGGKIIPFYNTGREDKLVLVITPYNDTWPVPIPEIIASTQYIPEREMSLKNYLEQASAGSLWNGPYVVEAPSGYAHIYYTRTEQPSQFPQPFYVVTAAGSGFVSREGTVTPYAPKQEVTVYLGDSDYVLIDAAGHWTLVLRQPLNVFSKPN